MFSRSRAAAALSSAAVLAAWAFTAAGPAAAASSATPWPSSPNWQSYVETPGSANVCPTAIQSTSGTVSGAANLVCGGSGGATLTMTSGGTTPTIVLDYGKEVAVSPTSASRRHRARPSWRPGTARA
jgi:alpha-L-rhamnosidase